MLRRPLGMKGKRGGKGRLVVGEIVGFRHWAQGLIAPLRCSQVGPGLGTEGSAARGRAVRTGALTA